MEAPKRQKTTHGEGGSTTAAAANAGSGAADVSMIAQEVFHSSTVAAAREAYAGAKPYAHGVVTPLCDDGFLREVQMEMREHLTATFKETDLFKLLQTGDLVNIDTKDPSVAAKIPQLLRLREAIYSPAFREMVQTMTGCPPLTDRTDCAASIYPRSGHLLCHDDVIGTRCISYIIYLTAGYHVDPRLFQCTHSSLTMTVPRTESHDSFARVAGGFLTLRVGSR